MWYRVAFGVAWAIAALFLFAGPALAGNWAVTTLDGLPEGGFQAGVTYRLGYTIRQHGQNPYDDARTAIRITSASTLETKLFQGVPDGPRGHYVAEVRFPSAGEWLWEVSQHQFATQTLGTIAVAPAPASATAAEAPVWDSALVAPVAATEPTGNNPARPGFLVPVATALALGALGLAAVARRRRGSAPLRVGRAAPGL